MDVQVLFEHLRNEYREAEQSVVKMEAHLIESKQRLDELEADMKALAELTRRYGRDSDDAFDAAPLASNDPARRWGDPEPSDEAAGAPFWRMGAR